MASDELTKIVPIPLPTEIPEPPALENLPLDVLHSATVEMLIQQNDDLASRLKVNIRRNSVQEQEILTLQRQLNELKKNIDNLKSQNEIIKEKESLWQRQRQAKERQLKANEEEIKLLELRYNELYTATKHKKKELYREIVDKNESIENLKKKVDARKQVSERGKDKMREMLLSAAGALKDHKITAKQVTAQSEIYKKQISELKELAKKNETLFKTKMLELSKVSKKQIQSLEEEIQTLKGSAKEQEKKEQATKKQLEDTKQSLEQELKGREQISQLTAEIVQIKNEKIALERSLKARSEGIEQENKSLLEQKKILEKENSSLSLQLNEHKGILETCEKRLIEVTRDNEDTSKQLESVKTLWMELQHKYEKEQLKSESLNKINKQLSQKISLEKKEKSIERAQEGHDDFVAKSSNQDSSFNERLSDIYSSQFGPLDKRNLDL